MTYQVLARKWRPKNFDQVVGQKFAIDLLVHSLRSQRIAQAYLFTGTRGVGKTSMARIFAKALRCQNKVDGVNPCLSCVDCLSIEEESNLNYLEVDGASHNSVDNIREIIENSSYLPTSGQYKIYVIDEVHMLSQAAFNALLKTLEEPPAHCIFILATTDPQKIPMTILSRCQRIDFKHVTDADLLKHINHICQMEEVTFSSESLKTKICRKGGGSIRDTLSLLEQALTLSPDRVINDDLISSSLGLAKDETINLLLKYILQGDQNGVQKVFASVSEFNLDLENFTYDFLYRLHFLITLFRQNDFEQIQSEFSLQQEFFDDMTVVELIWIYELLNKDLRWGIESFHPSLTFEIIFIKAALRREVLQPQKKNTKKTAELAAEVKKEEPPARINFQVWEQFLKHVLSLNSAMGINLERAALFRENGPKEVMASEAKLFYSKNNHVFYEYMENKEHKVNFIKIYNNYFKIKAEDGIINIHILDDQEYHQKGYINLVDLDNRRKKLALQQQKDRLTNDNYVNQVCHLFNTKVNKLILNREDQTKR